MFIIAEPGIQNTIQDAGRWGFQAYGVPVSGAMDLFSLHAANELVGNALNEAAIEVHSPMTFATDRGHLLAVTGAQADIEVNGRVVPMWTTLFVRGGSTVEVRPRRGGWVYVAVYGGVDIPPVLGSKSTYVRGGFGGLNGTPLCAGDEIRMGEGALADLASYAGKRASELVIAHARRKSPARVMLGPHADHFDASAIAALTGTTFIVTESADRMGYRLQGAALAHESRGELVSCGVPLGAIQVPHDGQPIVLTADHQTTGGYPIIATVVSEDIPIIAQTPVGDAVSLVIVEEAFER